jgi:hypothetical protein
MAIKNTLIGNPSATPIFSANTGTEYAITTIIFCNTSDVNDAYLDVWAVPTGSVPSSASTQILNNVYIPKGETFVMDSEKLILSSGDAIWAQTSPVNSDQIVCATVSTVVI